MHGAMIPCKTSFIVVLWFLPCCSLLFCLEVFYMYNWYCCCHFTILCIVESSNKQLISNKRLLINTPYLFCYVSVPFLVFVLQLLSFWSSKAKFNVSSHMLLLFIYNFVGLNDDIVMVLQPWTLLQASSTTCFKWVPPCHFAFVGVFFCCFKKP